MQAASVPKGASLPNPGDKVVLDGTGMSNGGASGILGSFDLLALAAPAGRQGIDKQSEIRNLKPAQAASDLPSQTGLVPSEDTTSSFAKDSIPAPASPQTVDALVAMDKTARNGLAARKAAPPIERDWTLAVTVPSAPTSLTETPVPWPSLTLNLGQALAPSPSQSLPSAESAITADAATTHEAQATPETETAADLATKLVDTPRDLIAQPAPVEAETAVATLASALSVAHDPLDQPKQTTPDIQSITDIPSNAEAQSNTIISVNTAPSSNGVTTHVEDSASHDLAAALPDTMLAKPVHEPATSESGIDAQAALQTDVTRPTTLDRTTSTKGIAASETPLKQTEARVNATAERVQAVQQTSKSETAPPPVTVELANVIQNAPAQETVPAAPVQTTTPANTDPALQNTGTLSQPDLQDPASPSLLEANTATATSAAQDQEQDQALSGALKPPVPAKPSHAPIRMTAAPITDGSRAQQIAVAMDTSQTVAASTSDSSDLQTLTDDTTNATVQQPMPQAVSAPMVDKEESVIAASAKSPQVSDTHAVVDRNPQTSSITSESASHPHDRKRMSSLSQGIEAQAPSDFTAQITVPQPASTIQSIPTAKADDPQSGAQDLADTALNETAISNTASRGKKRSVAELADRQEKRAPAMAASVKTAAEPSPPSDTEDFAQEPLHHVASDNAVHAAKSETQSPSATTATASDPLGFDANESAQNNLVTPSSDQTLTTSTIGDTLNGKADDKPHAEDLPPSVTIESVTLRSGGHEHDTDASAPSPSADQTVQESHIPITLSQSDTHPSYASDSGYRSNASTSQLDYSPIATTPQTSSTHVDNPAFVAQRQRAFEQQIMSALRNGGSEVRAMLYPPQLGQVTINLILDGNKVRLSAKTSSRDATNTLMNEKPSLASALDDEGFVLTGFDVRDDASNNSSSDDPSSSSPIETIHTPKPSASRADASFSLDITI